MENLTIKATSTTPLAVFETNGNLTLKGRSLILDVTAFYQPFLDWVNILIAPKVVFTIELEYFNSASSKKLLEILRTIDSNNQVREFEVNWNYETDDEDILEKGQIFEEKLRKARFIYKEYAEAIFNH
ncbi:MAG TPA: DUF1987 domain-containing protein [Bacteroidales bacterium]|nr:DUF1987 domain-containing protein [Bacteroidales bacterium]